MLHLQLLGRDPLNPTDRERVLFEDQVVPPTSSGVAFQNQLFTLRGRAGAAVRGGDHVIAVIMMQMNRQGSFPNRRRFHPRSRQVKHGARCFQSTPLTLLKASVTLADHAFVLSAIRSTSNYGHVILCHLFFARHQLAQCS